MGGTPGWKVMATRGSSAVTSDAWRSLRPVCCQLSLVPEEEPELPSPAWWEDWEDRPRLVPPPATTCVNSPRRLLTYSAVCRSLTPKNTWVMFERNVSWPSGKHFFSWPRDW